MEVGRDKNAIPDGVLLLEAYNLYSDEVIFTPEWERMLFTSKQIERVYFRSKIVFASLLLWVGSWSVVATTCPWKMTLGYSLVSGLPLCLWIFWEVGWNETRLLTRALNGHRYSAYRLLEKALVLKTTRS